jgi:hypothetical protein
MRTHYARRASTYITALLLAACATALPHLTQNASAQVEGVGGVGLLVAAPQGELADELDAVGFGLNLWAGLRPAGSPLVIGLDGGFLIYGSERERIPFLTNRVLVDVVTTNNIAMGHLFARVQPPVGPVKPYLEGLVGFKYFFTESRIEDDDFDDNEAIASTTNFDDIALSYGVGGGIDVRLFSFTGDQSRPFNVSLSLSSRYLWGGEADYLGEGGITDTPGGLSFDVRRSATDLLFFSVGITIC